MPILDFIITVFCLVDDEWKMIDKRLRQRGFEPNLSDSEVMTMEVVGEFLGLDTDKGIWSYFKTHGLDLFPKMVDRSNFARQAVNLHVIKRMIQERLSQALGALSDSLHSIDGLPIPVCKFARAHYAKIFKGVAAYG